MLGTFGRTDVDVRYCAIWNPSSCMGQVSQHQPLKIMEFWRDVETLRGLVIVKMPLIAIVGILDCDSGHRHACNKRRRQRRRGRPRRQTWRY